MMRTAPGWSSQEIYFPTCVGWLSLHVVPAMPLASENIYLTDVKRYNQAGRTKLVNKIILLIRVCITQRGQAVA
jgi:hypothetical protein